MYSSGKLTRQVQYQLLQNKARKINVKHCLCCEKTFFELESPQGNYFTNKITFTLNLFASASSRPKQSQTLRSIILPSKMFKSLILLVFASYAVLSTYGRSLPLWLRLRHSSPVKLNQLEESGTLLQNGGKMASTIDLSGIYQVRYAILLLTSFSGVFMLVSWNYYVQQPRETRELKFWAIKTVK